MWQNRTPLSKRCSRFDVFNNDATGRGVGDVPTGSDVADQAVATSIRGMFPPNDTLGQRVFDLNRELADRHIPVGIVGGQRDHLLAHWQRHSHRPFAES